MSNCDKLIKLYIHVPDLLLYDEVFFESARHGKQAKTYLVELVGDGIGLTVLVEIKTVGYAFLDSAKMRLECGCC